MFVILWVAAAFSAVPDEVAQRLRLRDGWGGCDAVWALGSADEVRDALADQTRASMPPWAPMRAATCLAARADDEKIRPILKSWVADPAVPGLARITLAILDRFPEADAVETVRSAMALDLPLVRGEVKKAVETSVHPGVRALSNQK
jgi:hypothetical protein